MPATLRKILPVLAAALLLFAAVAPAREKLKSPLEGMEAVERAVVESGVGRLAVQRGGLDISLLQHATYRLYDMTGKSQIGDAHPVHSYLSMLYAPEKWTDTPLFPVDHPQLAVFIDKPFKSRLAPSEVSSRLVQRLQLLAGYFDFLDHTLYRQLLDIPSAEPPDGLSRRQFAGIVHRAMRLHTLEENLDAQGSKISTEQYRQIRASLDEEALGAEGIPEAEWEYMEMRGAQFAKMADAIYVSYQAGLIPWERLVDYIGLIAHDGIGHPVELQNFVNDLANLGPVSSDLKDAVNRLRGRIAVFNNRFNDFALVAVPGSLDRIWKAPPEAAHLASQVSMPAHALHNALVVAYQDGKTAQLGPAVEDFLGRMRSTEGYTSDARRLASYYYSRTSPFFVAAFVYLAAAGFFMAAFRRNDPRGTAYKVASGLLVLAFLFHTAGLTARVLIMQRAPVSNIWESIVWVSWGSIVFGTCLEWRFRRIFAGVLTALGGFAVLFSAWLMPNDMEQVQPLRAVLNSSWLTYHVLSITLSYAAFLVATLFAMALLVRESPLGRTRLGDRLLPESDMLEVFAYRAIQIGYPLLTWGIFSGAVWADHAWGRFWAWDPKETWSLITWLVYTIFLHLRLRHGLSGRMLAWAAIAGFASVLVTWLGVSYLPIFAGLHSYASG